MSSKRGPEQSEAACVNVVISSPLEDKYVDRIRAVDSRVNVLYEASLLPTTRYVADHVGESTRLTGEELIRWRKMTQIAEVSFDFDRRNPGAFNGDYPRVRWVQATSSGLAQVLDAFPLDFDKVTVTTAAGVHSQPLAEFVLASVLYFVKGFPQLKSWQTEHRWTRYTSRSLSGQRALVVGLGHVGRQAVKILSDVGIDVVGAVRTGGSPSGVDVSATVNIGSLEDILPGVDFIVLCCPLTEQTRGLIGSGAFDAMKPGAVLINIARGGVVDHAALVEALRSGKLGGASLDATDPEPLPEGSPLWDMENVLISPHSASTVDEENQKITDLFCENLRRWLRNETLLNVYQPGRGY